MFTQDEQLNILKMLIGTSLDDGTFKAEYERRVKLQEELRNRPVRMVYIGHESRIERIAQALCQKIAQEAPDIYQETGWWVTFGDGRYSTHTPVFEKFEDRMKWHQDYDRYWKIVWEIIRQFPMSQDELVQMLTVAREQATTKP